MKHKRAPNGYRIKQWADGFYHVYHGGECLAETLDHAWAIAVAKLHQQSAQQPFAADAATRRG